jgi:hypothetical protein
MKYLNKIIFINSASIKYSEINLDGSKNLYNTQKINFDTKSISEIDLLKRIEIIHKHKKGLEQEVLINRNQSPESCSKP